MRKKWNLTRLKKIAELCGRGVILDIGFASNPNVFLRGRVIGIDRIPCKAPPNYSDALVAGETLPFCSQVDAICAGEIIEHLEDPIRFLVECNKALKYGGKLVLSTPNPYHLIEALKNIFGDGKSLYSDSHLHLFPYRIMLKLLDLSGFRIIGCYGNYIKVPGIPLRIPMQPFPTISSSIIYFSKKVDTVRFQEIYPKLHRKMEKYYEDYQLKDGKLPAWCD